MKKLKLTINGEVKTFDLPENGVYKVEVVNKYVPKVGDCVKISFKNAKYEYFGKINQIVQKFIRLKSAVRENDTLTLILSLYYDERDIFFTKITPDELKAKYAEFGYDWDYESDTVEHIKWKPKNGDTVWYLTELLEVSETFYFNDNYDDNDLLKKGFLFPTEAECQKFADHCMSYFKNKKE